MRVLLVEPGANFSVQDVANGWHRGLKEVGAQVAMINFNARLQFYALAHIENDKGEWEKAVDQEGAVALAQKGIQAACYEMVPDVVIIVSGFFVSDELLDLIRARGSKVVLLHTESPYEDDRQVSRAEHADINVLNDPTNLERFPNAYYQPHSYDPAIHRRLEPEAEHLSDFCFVGTGYPSRAAFLEAVDWTGIDVALGGNWGHLHPESVLRKFVAHDIAECIDNADAVKLYAATKVSANLYRREAQRPELSDGWACGPREIELAASQRFFLRDSRGESDELFPMLPTFSGPEDFEEKLRWWLDHPAERGRAESQAYAAIADRTFANAAKRLLERL